jgi:hypothetical protein
MQHRRHTGQRDHFPGAIETLCGLPTNHAGIRVVVSLAQVLQSLTGASRAGAGSASRQKGAGGVACPKLPSVRIDVGSGHLHRRMGRRTDCLDDHPLEYRPVTEQPTSPVDHGEGDADAAPGEWQSRPRG